MTVAPDPGWETLLTEVGRSLLSRAGVLRGDGASWEQVNALLRREHEGADPAVIAATVSQTQLREKAASKFGALASNMLVTQAGLEQASRQVVAQAHAERFSLAGVRRVADLGCGIGSESLAFKRAGLDVLAVEIDALTAAFANHNLDLISGRHEVLHADATVVATERLTPQDGVFIDPARRTRGHRETSRLACSHEYSPPLDFAFDLCSRHPSGVKLGPGFDRALLPSGAEAQWVSVNGETVETGIWFGDCARPGITRSALLLQTKAGVLSRHELTAAFDAPDAPVRDIGDYLYEPDGAVIRARLIGMLADHIGGGMVDPHLAYITSDREVATPFAQGFRVVEELPAKPKELARCLRERGIGTLEIKKRGVDVDPAQLRKQLRLRGSERATIIFARIGDARRCFLVERL